MHAISHCTTGFHHAWKALIPLLELCAHWMLTKVPSSKGFVICSITQH